LLDHVFKPVVEQSAEPGTTLGQVLDSVGLATRKLSRYGMPYHTFPHKLGCLDLDR
jgi:outer membrane protein insertion porin family